MNQLNILFEDNDILVCEKPAGLATESANIRTPDLTSIIKKYLGKPYLGLVHRLDQPVSGILVFAKNPTAAANLSKQLQDRILHKFYTAVVIGNIFDSVLKEPGTSMSLCNYLVKDPRQNKAVIVSEGEKGPDNKPAKKATLIIKGQSYDALSDTSVVKIELLTGRFHQIRAQLSNLGYPILGDVKYGATRKLPDDQKGIALSADILTFTHPITGKEMTFSLKETII